MDEISERAGKRARNLFHRKKRPFNGALQKNTMKTPKLLVMLALGLGTLTAVHTPVFAKGHHARHASANPLGLSADQKSGIKPIRKDAKAQIAAIKADKTLSKADRKARIKAIKADRKAKENALLTPAQQQTRDERIAQKKAARKAKRDAKKAAKAAKPTA